MHVIECGEVKIRRRRMDVIGKDVKFYLKKGWGSRRETQRVGHRNALI